MSDKLNYLEKIEKTNSKSFNNENQEEKIYETDELLNIIHKKWEDEKVKQANYVGNVKRYIPVTNLYGCARKLTYVRLGYKPDINLIRKYPHTILINEVGSFIHDQIAKLLGIYDITKQYFIADEYKVRGKCDGILYNALIEIKTTEELPKKLEDIHLLQARILYHLAKKYGNYSQINLIKILYIKRNLKEYKEFNIHINDNKNIQIVLPYLQKGIKIYECILNKQLSDDVNKQDCFFCGYQNICEYSSIRKQPQIKTQPTKSSFLKTTNQKIISDNTSIDESLKSTTNKTGEQIKTTKKDDIEWII